MRIESKNLLKNKKGWFFNTDFSGKYITYGNDKFVACSGEYNEIIYSNNGKVWLRSDSQIGSFRYSPNVYGLKFTGDRFIIWGERTTWVETSQSGVYNQGSVGFIGTSSDGNEWSFSDLNFDTYNGIRDVIYRNGKYVIVGCNFSNDTYTGTIKITSDLKNFTTKTFQKNSIITSVAHKITMTSGALKVPIDTFIALAQGISGGNDYYLYSTDTTTWTTYTNDNYSMNEVISDDNKFIVTTSNGILRSTFGTDWDYQSIPGNWTRLKCTNGIISMIDNKKIATSKNTVDWNFQTVSTALTHSIKPNGNIAFGDNVAVLIEYDGIAYKEF